ncbi:uncharacterized protein LOC114931710 isoform X1 [Nylanderia fulva]|uniref:uncharacterized protein LOC114931710 isoform X1 n=1 Tax=Nylanderia fulva TaxID=613905 RepID=UPI0010FBA14E|nr:uncharacterized protein LOC114931710 isoform X1 [Nylanderia fulva]
MENLVKLVSDVRGTNLADNYTLAAFLDVSAAYDNVDFDILIEKLRGEKCPTGIYNFINRWLEPRDTSFVINNQRVEIRKVNKGLPQGAVLSPILYALYTNKLTSRLENSVQIVQFADDIAVYVQSSNRFGNKINLEVAVNRIAKNLEILKLDLAPHKTNLVEFSKKGFCDKRLSINVKKTRIFNNQGARFLGIWLDNKLDFDKQVSDIRGKVSRANNIMKYLSNITRGVEVNTALILYKSIVRSVMDYGLFVYSPTSKSVQLKLERGQFLGIRTALGYRNSTPNNVLIAESKVILLKDRALMLAKNFCSKIFKYGENTLRNSLNNLLNKEMFARYRNPSFNKSTIGEAWEYTRRFSNRLGAQEHTFEIWNMEYSSLTNAINIDFEIGKIIKKKGKKSDCDISQIKGYRTLDIKMINEIKQRYKLDNKTFIMYTDGSKDITVQSTGAGIAIEEQDEGYYISLPKECTIFTVEAIAISTALKIAESRRNSFNNVVIFFDSKSVLQAISQNNINVYKNKYVLEIRRLYSRFKDLYFKNILFVWIPSHYGISGNEIADFLAKAGTQEPANVEFDIPIRDLRNIYKNEAWIRTQEYVIRDSKLKGKYYFSNFYDRNSKIP